MEDRFADDGVTKLLDKEASDKIQILSAPIQLPGVCGLCGTSRTDDRQYIDIGLWLEFYGHFYFCTFCMTQMVNRLGGLTPEQAEDLQEELNQARQAILEFQEQKAALDGAIDTLRNTGLFSDSNDIVSDPVEFVDTKQEPDGIKRNEQATSSTTADTSKTPGKQGSNGISSPRSDELDSWL